MNQTPFSCYLACVVLCCSASVVAAQDAQATSDSEQDAAAVATAARAQMLPVQRRVEIGAATQSLLQMQREGQALRSRPIDGEQAERSYARYLKSFEHPIPASYESGIDAKQ